MELTTLELQAQVIALTQALSRTKVALGSARQELAQWEAYHSEAEADRKVAELRLADDIPF